MDEANLKRFGAIVRSRRLALGLKQDQVAEAGGPSDKRQTKIEHGAPPAPSLTTLAKVDKGLQWAAGSAAATLNGGHPTPLEEPTYTQEEVDRRVALEMALQRAGVKRVAARGAHKNAAGSGLSPEVVDQLIDLLNSLPPESQGGE
ncbi:hypothetical protein OPAG_08329 [Rhodococcus opacus PD630]|uniref:helix-turn-helix domain-containing protein n=1 Tax=Rhodococcus opacus TaxID=37919 RepID=UPI00029CAF36|nr:helix-turn-helix domain-containing protein [Rhodococcus opacus]AHK35458.1 hypothetical protein Pd630_LPD10008 [Rhodococcus opacus PD630]EHI39052.1 hypothetical protein OPAG_08329 [Rhodococcus opacus PD630]UDH01723.1 helix-turn-helix domain-containing protein [Rhodococcus opacus PD630]